MRCIIDRMPMSTRHNENLVPLHRVTEEELRRVRNNNVLHNLWFHTWTPNRAGPTRPPANRAQRIRNILRTNRATSNRLVPVPRPAQSPQSPSQGSARKRKTSSTPPPSKRQKANGSPIGGILKKTPSPSPATSYHTAHQSPDFLRFFK